MSASSADTAQHFLVHRARYPVTPGPPVEPVVSPTTPPVVVPGPMLADVTSPPARRQCRGRAEHLAELRQARRQRRMVAVFGLAVMAGTLLVTIVVLDVLH